MKIIIAGGRDITDPGLVMLAMAHSGWIPSEVVSGGATGVDALGEQWAAQWGIPVRRFPADWKRHGNAAGPIRNREMAAYADALVAIWDGKSRGTANMISEAQQRGLQVYVYRLDQPNIPRSMPA